MKTFIIADNVQNPAAALLASYALKSSAKDLSLELVDDINQAELIIIAGERAPANHELTGKNVYFSTIEQAILNPAEVITKAKTDATVYSAATAPAVDKSVMNILAVTACPTGVAHTYMSAEALQEEAKKRGWNIKVETRGSVGVGNEISAEEIAKADLVIVAADIEVNVDKFAGLPMYRTSTSAALKKTAQEMDKAQKKAVVFQPQAATSTSAASQKGDKRGAYRHLLTGISYMLPMVVAGGLATALSFAFGLDAASVEGSLAWALSLIGGGTALALMVPVLSAYIAYSIADRTGLTPGLVGGVLATTLGAGFLGGIISGFIAGYSAYLVSSKLKLPKTMEALKPILLVPLISTLITGLSMIYVIGHPVAWIMTGLTSWLATMGTTNAIILGAILGAMMCSDMGGPINKAAYAFGVGLLSSQSYGPMAAIMAAGMVPPLAMGITTLIARHKFVTAEREAGKTALVLGCCFISEGAIPFAAKDPIRVIPSCLIGGAITGAMAMYFGVNLMTAHGGLIIMLFPSAINYTGYFLLSIVVGTLVSALIYAVIKRPVDQETQNIMGKIA